MGWVKVFVTQSCLTLCDPLDCSPPDSSSMEFSRPEYLSGLPFPSPRDLHDPGIKPGLPTLQTDSVPSEPPGKSFGSRCRGFEDLKAIELRGQHDQLDTRVPGRNLRAENTALGGSSNPAVLTPTDSHNRITLHRTMERGLPASLWLCPTPFHFQRGR